MTPQEFESAINELKSILETSTRDDKDRTMINIFVNLGAEFIKAHFISADSISRLAAAMEAQTKMMATIYSLDGNGAPVSNDGQGELPL